MDGHLIIRHTGVFPEIFNGEVLDFQFHNINTGFVSLKFKVNNKWNIFCGGNLNWHFVSDDEILI